MNFVFQIAIENAVLVALAAPLVWAISRLARRPALTHALWLIVLIKLVTLPVYRPAISLPRETTGPEKVAVTQPELNLNLRLDRSDVSPGTVTSIDSADSALMSVQVATPAPPASKPASPIPLVPIVQIVWITGSAVCLLIALGRIIRFSRSLRHAHRAPPELQSRVAQLSRRLGLGSAPTVQFIPASLCPMLWAVGRSPRLLIPVALWGRLDPRERDTIILHELAHFRRRDHWVRWIELAATTIYWWNPLCWWARRELREAEEQCCDAWVLHATGDFKPYANALLRAVEFISAPISSSPRHEPLPALASGMGQFNHLKRRIVMLKTASVARALSPRTLVAALGFSAVLLPLSPSLKGQAQTPPATPAHVTATPAQVSGVTDVPVTTSVTVPATLDLALDDSASPEDQLKMARKEIQDLRQRLAQAEARLAMYRAKEQGITPQNMRPGASIPPAAVNTNRNSNGQPERAQVEVEVHNDPLSLKRGIHDGKYRTVITDPATGRIKEVIERPLPPPTNTAQQADRLDKLEAQLRDLLHELQAIRQQSTPPSVRYLSPTPETRDLPARK